MSKSISERGNMGGRKRRPVAVFIIPLLVALLGFYRVTESPQFESYRTVDVVRLVASGACFGAALTGLIVMLLRPRR
jgi:hypothetical protein